MTATSREWYVNPAARHWRCAPVGDEPAAFHRTLDGYAPTSLIEVPTLAEALGVARVFVKDESRRLGLPAFKILGASWAVHRALSGAGPADSRTLVAATDGNHGHALARTGRLRGRRVRVYLPSGVDPAVASAIEAEGADAITVPAPYDDTVAAAAGDAERTGALLIQDTSWDGYEQVPGWIVAGYETLMAEIDRQLAAADAGPPDLIAVPVGVGSLAQAAVTHYRSGPAACVLSVEPEAAPCAIASLRTRERVSVSTGSTSMAGLNCGTLSRLAWPVLRDGLDAAVTVTEADTAEAIDDLAGSGVLAGPCGAASLAGARRALTGERSAGRRADLDIDRNSTVVLLSTEGPIAERG